MDHNRMPDMGMSIYNMNGCSCKHANCDFDNWPLAMAYVPMQPWEEPFDPVKGLGSGTIFPSLFLPFKGGGRK